MGDTSVNIIHDLALETILSIVSTSSSNSQAATPTITTSTVPESATSSLLMDNLLDPQSYNNQAPLIHLSRNFLSPISQTLNRDNNITSTLLSTLQEDQPHLDLQETIHMSSQPITAPAINNRTMHIIDLSKIPQIEPRTPPIGIAPPSYSVIMSQPPGIAPIPTFRPRFPPPPNYNTTYGLYTEYLGSILPTTQSGRFLSPRPLPIVCPSCGTLGVTVTRTHHSAITHLSALGLFLCFCWPCCILPYFMDTCKDSFHYCSNCEQYLGSYTPW